MQTRPDSPLGKTVRLLALEWPDGGQGGGVARLNERIARDLADLGYDVAVYLPRGDVPDYLRGHITSLPRLLRKLMGVKYVKRLVRYYVAPLYLGMRMRSAPSGTLISCGQDWALWGRRRVRIITGTSLSEARHSTNLLRRLNHYVLAGFETIEVLDPSVRLVTIGPDNPKGAGQPPLWPPTAGRRPVPDVDEGVRRRGAVFLGPYHGRKRGDLAVELVNRIRANDPDFSLTVFTGSDSAAMWPEWADVRIASSDAEVEEAIRSARFVISCSSYEGFGIPIYEAMAYGCIPIATDSPGSRYILNGHGLEGLRLPVDSDAFVDAASELIRGLTEASELELARDCLARARVLYAEGSVEHLVRQP